MTLRTRVFVLGEIPVQDLFAQCNQLIGAPAAVACVDEPVGPNGVWKIANLPEQGLCAVLEVFYRPGGPLRAVDGGCEWYCDPGCNDGRCADAPNRLACWAEVHFQTWYGYRDEQGRNCGDLHAELVARLGGWLDRQGIRWAWENEASGEVHTGYEQLVELCADGFQASAWFRETILPLTERGE